MIEGDHAAFPTDKDQRQTRRAGLTKFEVCAMLIYAAKSSAEQSRGAVQNEEVRAAQSANEASILIKAIHERQKEFEDK